MEDPFAHHPGLRDLVTPPEDSFFRDFEPRDLLEDIRKKGMNPPFFTAEEREAARRDALDDHDGDLWVFAYGSLMWDPGVLFDELRRAYAPRHERRFILRDIWGARGTLERPGLMAALDEGDGCHGLAFRIPAARVEDETRRLWAREAPAPGYIPRMITVAHDAGEVQALAFLADHDTENMFPDMPRATQVNYLATGTGFLGASYDYIRNLADHFDALGIKDAHVTDLLAEVEERRQSLS